MDNADKLKAFLNARPSQFFCNRCLSEQVPVDNQVQVNQLTRPLRGIAPYRSGKVMCSSCNRDRECIAYK